VIPGMRSWALYEILGFVRVLGLREDEQFAMLRQTVLRVILSSYRLRDRLLRWSAKSNGTLRRETYPTYRSYGSVREYFDEQNRNA